MSIKVACTLEGRDLAVVKSLLNIQNIYNEVEFQYTDETRASHVIIFKEYLDNGSVYYGLNKSTENKIPILPSLNPRTLRDLFYALSSEEKSNSELNINAESIHSFETVLSDYKKSKINNRLKIQFQNDILVISKMDNIVWSSFETVEQLFAELKSKKWRKIEVANDSENENKNIQYTMEQFCWNYGFQIDDELINPESRFKAPKFKLISWPNYGEVVFKQEFIYLSSLVWKRSETFDSLVESSQIDQSIVKQFLNATLMTGHVVTFENENKIENNQPVQKKANPFLNGLKAIFGFSKTRSG